MPILAVFTSVLLSLPAFAGETVRLEAGLSFLECKAVKDGVVECQRQPPTLTPLAIELEEGEGARRGTWQGEASVKAEVGGFLVEGIVAVSKPAGGSELTVDAYLAAARPDGDGLVMDFIGQTSAPGSLDQLRRTTWMGRPLTPAPLELTPYLTVAAPQSR